jgi:hypothetical protein
MNVYNLLKKFKVVEINNAVGIRSGHIIAQAPLKKINYLAGNASVGTNDGTAEFVENGSILYLDVDGELKSPIRVSAAIKGAQQPILHFTEELFTTGLSEELRHYALEFSDDCVTGNDNVQVCNIAYPRGLVLHVGDAFTTNNYVAGVEATVAVPFANAKLAIVNGLGQFVLHTTLAAIGTAVTDYVGPLFQVVQSTLPDGETLAVELTVLAEVIAIA